MPSCLWLERAAFDAVMPCRLWLLGWRDVDASLCSGLAVRWIATAYPVALPTRVLGQLLYLGDLPDLSGERRPARVRATESRESLCATTD